LQRVDWSGWLLSVLRIVAGFLFAQHGYQKVLGAFGGFGGRGAVPVGSLLWIGGMLEIVGSALLLLGLFTRPVAFVLSGEMAAAYFRTHVPRGFWPIQNAGELAVVYSFLFLYLSAAGGGAWSLDRLLRRKR